MDKTLTVLILVFFLAFTVFTTVIVFNRPLNRLIKAQEEIEPSQKNSIVLAWPLSLKADSATTTTISVFVRSSQNKPITNKIVHLNTTLGEIIKNDIKTNDLGVAAFQLKSNIAGTAEISASFNNNSSITHKISIKFE